MCLPKTPQREPIALAIRHSHGRGETVGALVPAECTPEGAEFREVATRIHDIDVNFGVKVLV